MEATHSFKMSVLTRSTRHHIPEDGILQLFLCFHIFWRFLHVLIIKAIFSTWFPYVNSVTLDRTEINIPYKYHLTGTDPVWVQWSDICLSQGSSVTSSFPSSSRISSSPHSLLPDRFCVPHRSLAKNCKLAGHLRVVSRSRRLPGTSPLFCTCSWHAA
jgi:hypothetical protein